MRLPLVSPSDVSFGTAVITPRRLYVLAAATPARDAGISVIDETLARGAWVVSGGIHSTQFPEEPEKPGGAHAVMQGDGGVVWAQALEDYAAGAPQRRDEGGQVNGDRFDLMERRARLPDGMALFTQITMEAAGDVEFLKAMRRAHIRGALAGVEAATPEGLKPVFTDFNLSGGKLAERLRRFKRHDVHVPGSFIFGPPPDRGETFDATVALAKAPGLTFARFVRLTPSPGTVVEVASHHDGGRDPDAGSACQGRLLQSEGDLEASRLREGWTAALCLRHFRRKPTPELRVRQAAAPPLTALNDQRGGARCG